MYDVNFPPIARFRFTVAARGLIELPPYTGSTWRGLLATALRRSVCVPGLETCDTCLLTDFCAFYRFFEQGARADVQTLRYPNASPPFVLDLLGAGGRTLAPGEQLAVGLTIIGDSIYFLPYWVYAFQRAGDLGIGRGRGRFALTEVAQESALGADTWVPLWQTGASSAAPLEPAAVAFPAPPDGIWIELLTPLRIKRRGEWVTAADFTAAEFLFHLCQRLDRLESQFGTGEPGGFWDAHRAQLQALPPAPSELRWHDWTRYSSRQQQHMKLGGLLGRFRVPADALPDLWPLIWLGQYAHVGKNTSFGLGAYRALAG
ncbi:hypothetical protein CKO31_19775 [Thiohalocapsa halophila]|uniref:CRISPR-associated protein Cas6 C-terminal domain-containing protein n=1 Tax=Thiohalocapsa halophila TaxID=69359 RepID=A0ABS1CM65_9GAMM|nr:CRISPR system precrRNA processing endoribonuclease RAMP protein Cas6 [Thiohalocapsa halophila]MBK1632948.1 hypothetical protein [Thiohalocapsa halophila]